MGCGTFGSALLFLDTEIRLEMKTRQFRTTTFNPKKYVSLDTETTGVDVYGKSVPFMVSMCDEEGNTWVCQWPINPFTRNVTANPNDLSFIRKILSRPGLECIMHNSKFDCSMMNKVGIDIVSTCSLIHDTLFQARICFTLEMSYGLKYLSSIRLGIPNQDEKDLQENVISARRKLKSYNNKAASEKMKLMMVSPHVEEDYWLPAYFDKTDKTCESYAKLDAFRTMALFLFYKEIMDEDPYLQNKYEQEMRQIWPIVNTMEKRGMKVFPEAVKEESENCKAAMAKHLAVMNTIIKDCSLLPFPEDKTTCPPSLGKRLASTWKPPSFNPSSSTQLLRVLYLPETKGGLGLQTERRNHKTGNLTTDKDTLRELMYSPFVQELAGYRAAAHTLGLFFEKFQVLMKPDDLEKGSYCLHPGFNQCGTKTGRFSCANPNLQQVSAGGKKSLSASYNGAKVFGPRKGYVWLGFDYSQQEGRIFAFLAQVPVMLDALNNGVDLFEAMANRAWGGKGNQAAVKAVVKALELTSTSIPENEAVKQVWERYNFVPGSQNMESISDQWLAEFNYDIVAAETSLHKSACRQRTKHVTYAKIFGGGPGSYTHLLYCTLDEAKKFDKEYNDSMPEMKQFMKTTEIKARQDGFVINLYDRKLRVDRDFAYRGVSYIIQSSAADQTKTALANINSFLKSTKLDAHLIMTIHDSIYVEVAKKDYSLALVRAIKNRMEDTQGRIGVNMPTGIEIIDGRWGVNEEEIKL